ncbi:glycoside hydrolase family 99-like domain-containing protein [Ligilactobacillus salivarius]
MTDYQSFDKIWSYILNRKRTYDSKTIISGAFSGWDNSARKGKESMIVKGKQFLNLKVL